MIYKNKLLLKVICIKFVHLIKMPKNPLFMGLLGRDTIFQEFGFGFWERAQELHVTTNP